MKQLFCAVLVCGALMLPLWSVLAQDAEEAAEPAVQSEAAAAESPDSPKAEAAESSGSSGKAVKSNTASGGLGGSAGKWVGVIIGYLSQIGALFGQATGVRIGGTTGTGIAALIVAKLVKDKAPSWLQWLLYLTGGTMFAGGGANIVQSAMGYIQL